MFSTKQITANAWALLVCCLGLIIGIDAVMAAPPDPAAAVVAVVGLDDQGQPQRQGLGVTVGRDGKILTSASLVNSGRGVVRFGDGAKHLIETILWRDDLQDLALVKVAGENLPTVELCSPERLRPAEVVQGASRDDSGVRLKETRVAGLHPFSPRLTLVKLEQNLTSAEPGAPLFNRRGELVAMIHAFGGESSQERRFQVVLALDRTMLSPPSPAAKPQGDDSQTAAPLQRQPPSGLPPLASLKASPSGLGSPPGIPNSYAEFWQGVQASLAADWPVAQERFTKALAAPGGPPEAAFGRGVACYHLGDDVGALRDFHEAARRLPGYALASFWLGKTLERQGKGSEAREAYGQAVRQAPALQEAWFSLGLLAYREGWLDQAQEALEQVVTKEGSQAAQAFFYLGSIAQRRGLLAAADKAYRQAVNRDAGLLQAYLEDGKVLLEMGRPKEAVLILQKLLKRSPGQQLAHYYLALAHLAAWNSRQAWEEYFILQRLNPELAARLSPALEGGR